MLVVVRSELLYQRVLGPLAVLRHRVIVLRSDQKVKNSLLVRVEGLLLGALGLSIALDLSYMST